MPTVREIANNQSLVFIIGHFSYSDIVPLLPNQVEVGCIHCRPGNPLPEVSFIKHSRFKKGLLSPTVDINRAHHRKQYMLLLFFHDFLIIEKELLNSIVYRFIICHNYIKRCSCNNYKNISVNYLRAIISFTCKLAKHKKIYRLCI